MLLIDYREGSKDLEDPLREAGMEVEVVSLDFGDIAFEGKGEGGTPVEVGIEFKRISDLVSSLRTGRLAGHQMPGMRDLYDHTYLLMEGHWSTNKSGAVVEQHWHGRRPEWRTVKGKMNANEMEKRLLTLELQYGCHLRFTTSRRDSVAFLVALYRWWTDKSLDEHRSGLAVHVPSTVIPISAERRAVCMWPGVGVEWSRDVLEHFGSLNRAANASIETWAALTHIDRHGVCKRFGIHGAEKVVKFLRGRS